MTSSIFFFFFFNDTATTEIYTLSLHDALPICHHPGDEGHVEEGDEPRDPPRARERRTEQETAGGGGHREERQREDAVVDAGRHLGRQEDAQREQERGHAQPRPEHAPQQPLAVDGRHRTVSGHLTSVTILKMGRYMATTMPPTTTPRKTIIIGSSNEVSAVTAASTSSS